MHTRCVSERRAWVSLVIASLMAMAAIATADPIDDAEDLPATAEETQFIDAVISATNEAIPVLDGWHRDVSVTVSGNKVQEGRTTLIYAPARDYPLKILVQVNYREITAADREKIATERTAEQLQQELLEASMGGDIAKMQELQQQLAAVMQASMEAGPVGQATGKTPMQAREKPKAFHAQVVINGEGESIGKQYDFDTPGDATKAFCIDKDDSAAVTYKYYLGGWDVSELDRRNWRIAEPAGAKTAENHLRALVALVSVNGDRNAVEQFVADHLDLNSLNLLVD